MHPLQPDASAFSPRTYPEREFLAGTEAGASDVQEGERISIELMTSDRKGKASREGSKWMGCRSERCLREWIK